MSVAVLDAVRAVYQVASNAPGALLLEASNKYQTKSYQAYDYLRMDFWAGNLVRKMKRKT